MAITRTPIVDDDGSGTTGTVLDNAWKQELYNQIDGYVGAPGTWIPLTVNPADFTGSGGMTWTINSAQVYKYCVIGKILFLRIGFNHTIGGTASTQLFLKLPGGLLSDSVQQIPVSWTTPTLAIGLGSIAANGTQLSLYKDALNLGTTWPLGAGTVNGNMMLGVI